MKKAIDNIIVAKQNSLVKIEGKVVKAVEKSDTNQEIVLKFLQVYSRWWFNIPRIINWGSERDGFKRLKNIDYTEMEETLINLEKNHSIQSKKSNKNKNKFLYKIQRK